MLKERHRYGVRSSRAAPHRNAIAPPQVSIIPGNRFFLLPLKKVSALVRHHDRPCRGVSATSIQNSIEQKGPNRGRLVPSTDSSVRSPSNRSAVKQRRRHFAIARSHLGPIPEHEEGAKPLLDDPRTRPWNDHHVARIRKQTLDRAMNAHRINAHLYYRKAERQEALRIASHPSSHADISTRNVVTKPTGGWSHDRRRAKSTSIFTLERPLGDNILVQNRGSSTRVIPKTRFSAERESLVLEHVAVPSGDKKKKRSLVAFGRNRVSPSDQPCEVVSEKSFVAGNVRDSFGRLEGVSRRITVSCRDERDESFGVDQIRWSTWRIPSVCSLTDEKDLPIGPLRGISLKEQLLM